MTDLTHEFILETVDSRQGLIQMYKNSSLELTFRRLKCCIFIWNTLLNFREVRLVWKNIEQYYIANQQRRNWQNCDMTRSGACKIIDLFSNVLRSTNSSEFMKATQNNKRLLNRSEVNVIIFFLQLLGSLTKYVVLIIRQNVLAYSIFLLSLLF